MTKYVPRYIGGFKKCGGTMIEINNKHLCELCFSQLQPTMHECPHCSGQRNRDKYLKALDEGSILAGRYIVGMVLGKGGFGVTYLCYDFKEDTTVAVKEYLPDSLAHRNSGEDLVLSYGDEREEYFKIGARKFYDEARFVSRFNGSPGIISVYEFFFENNTVYFVMEYLDGIDLKRYIAEKRGKISESEAIYILDRLTKSLTEVHDMEILHRDISPDNIFICRNGDIKLIDFGAARQLIGEASKSLSVILKQGFAPIEQYQRRGKQGPWTDIYALGATIYYALTGNILDDAMSRFEEDTLDSIDVSPDFMKILKKMLALWAKDRYQSVSEIEEDLSTLSIDFVAPVIDEEKETRLFCERCGGEIESGYTHCPECGMPLKKESDHGRKQKEKIPNQTKAPDMITDHGQRKKRKKGLNAIKQLIGTKKSYIICTCIALIFIIGILAYFGLK